MTFTHTSCGSSCVCQRKVQCVWNEGDEKTQGVISTLMAVKVLAYLGILPTLKLDQGRSQIIAHVAKHFHHSFISLLVLLFPIHTLCIQGFQSCLVTTDGPSIVLVMEKSVPMSLFQLGLT